MDVLEKANPTSALYDIYKHLRFNNVPITAIGTSSLASQDYTSDFDFMSVIRGKVDKDKAFAEFSRIIDNVSRIPKLYFVEFKIQQKDGTKYKIFKTADFTKEYFSHFTAKTKYCKLDGMIFIDGYFKEISVNYLFKPTKENIHRKLLEDKEEHYHAGNFYKSLKRLFSATRYAKNVDKSLLVKLTQFFNSELGKLYETYSKLETLQLFLEKTGNTKTAQVVLSNIGLKGLKIKDIPRLAKDYKKLLDVEALKHYDEFEK